MIIFTFDSPNVRRREQKNYGGNYTPYNPSINLSYARIAAPNAITFLNAHAILKKYTQNGGFMPKLN